MRQRQQLAGDWESETAFISLPIDILNLHFALLF